MKKICLIIGHGGKDTGAVNPNNGYTELKYNSELVPKIVQKLQGQYEILLENRGNNSIEDIAKINSFNPEIIISFHCNDSEDDKGTGTEAIYYPGSTKGKELATIVSKNVSEALGLKNRGAKTPWQNRGMGLLQRTKAPCIISEGFFIDNDSDLKAGLDKMDNYVAAIVKSVHEYLGDSSEGTEPEQPEKPDTKIYLVQGNKTIGEIDGTIKLY
ncbi:Sporulation-specific N-acetylmuramoyl-L-alanine amidase [Sebaldella termitidis]|uniref:Cell wall hydrolase/autolysin n=1 Tax=Sebaldella termitidis (strain ATCC 33386 / NCTC 11300) TaxID=526218 RepID=D1AN56_SEBTE|nr:N-acetylmuramoyl-L-alanine amidase [Sebaldella termitidis]ACZ09660.1 cell wall hydrolase/autolysin [Sebaldella termitidis ATCC 33386]SUI24992.1 Sporulation-specific N-acetylmuramoyl-L-alanine amidase [Sebaldella termitidis]